MKKTILVKAIKNNYPKFKEFILMNLSGSGITNDIFIIKDKSYKYVVKIYKNNNLKKILSEHAILDNINKKIVESIYYIKNKYNKTYACVKIRKHNFYFAIYRYKNGNILSKVSFENIKKIALSLSNFHVEFKSDKFKNNVLIRDVILEFRENINNLNKALQILDRKKTLNPKEIIIKQVILKKLNRLRSYNFQKDIKKISFSSTGFIHGDFAPSNILFKNGKLIGILDWENACRYNLVWEIFRSMCHSSKMGKNGLICSKINLKKAGLFLRTYLSKNRLNLVDVSALKLMPKYYYFLDSYIITSYILNKNSKLSDLISNNINDYFWIENHKDEFINLIDKYAKQRI